MRTSEKKSERARALALAEFARPAATSQVSVEAHQDSWIVRIGPTESGEIYSYYVDEYDDVARRHHAHPIVDAGLLKPQPAED